MCGGSSQLSCAGGYMVAVNLSTIFALHLVNSFEDNCPWWVNLNAVLLSTVASTDDTISAFRCFLTYQSCQSLIYRRCLLHDSIAPSNSRRWVLPGLGRGLSTLTCWCLGAPLSPTSVFGYWEQEQVRFTLYSVVMNPPPINIRSLESPTSK